MNDTTQFIIRMTSAVIKCVCGFMLLGKVSGTQSFLFAISGFMLMLAGVSCIAPWLFNRIELYIMNKRDPECGITREEK